MSPGAANITAAYGSNKAVARVTVARDERGRVQTLDLLADSVTADVRTGSRFVPLSAYNGYGQPVCPPALTITTSDATIATAGIGGCGVQIYPHFAGTATITVRADGGQDSVSVRVTSTGTVVYISSRPDAAQGLAGNKVSYTVRVLDQQGNPVANHLVRFGVSAGTLGAATATTDNTGSATVQWTLPTALAAFGNVQTIRAGTQLPDGDLYYLSESLYVYPGPPVSFQLLRLDPPNSTFTPITTASITAHAYETVYIGALATDQYGNNTGYDFHFSVSGTGSLTCPSSGFRYGNSGIVYSCAYANAAGTLTYTVSAGGTSKSVDIVAN
jgi:hypothetical protein